MALNTDHDVFVPIKIHMMLQTEAEKHEISIGLHLVFPPDLLDKFNDFRKADWHDMIVQGLEQTADRMVYSWL